MLRKRSVHHRLLGPEGGAVESAMGLAGPHPCCRRRAVRCRQRVAGGATTGAAAHRPRLLGVRGAGLSCSSRSRDVNRQATGVTVIASAWWPRGPSRSCSLSPPPTPGCSRSTVSAQRGSWSAAFWSDEAQQLAFNQPCDGAATRRIGRHARRVESSGRVLTTLRALAWTTVAHLRRSSGDFPGAESALARAAKASPEGKSSCRRKSSTSGSAPRWRTGRGGTRRRYSTLLKGLRLLRGQDQPRAWRPCSRISQQTCIATGARQARDRGRRIGISHLGPPRRSSDEAQLGPQSSRLLCADAGDILAARTLHQQLSAPDGSCYDDMVRWRHRLAGRSVASRIGRPTTSRAWISKSLRKRFWKRRSSRTIRH